MLKTKQTTQFKKDIKLAKKRNKKLEKLKKVMNLIVFQKELPIKYKTINYQVFIKNVLNAI